MQTYIFTRSSEALANAALQGVRTDLAGRKSSILPVQPFIETQPTVVWRFEVTIFDYNTVPVWSGAVATTTSLALLPVSPPSLVTKAADAAKIIAVLATALYYGAIGDGVADDTLAVQAAHNAHPAVFYPAGMTFKITDTIVMPVGGSAVGYGNKSVLKQTTLNKACLVAADDCLVTGLKLSGPSNVPLTSGSALNVNCGVFVGDVKRVTIDKNTIEGWGLAGISCSNGRDVTITDNVIYNTHYNLEADINNSGADILVYGGGASNRGRYIITGNHCLGDTSTGIAFSLAAGVKDCVIANNITDCLDPVTWVQKVRPANVNFTGSISGTTLTVASVQSGSHVLVVGTRVYANGLTDGTKITALGTGTGGVGTYTLSNSASLTSRNMQGGINAPQFINRRHGISYNYSGGPTSGRAVVTGNICQNTLISGIYAVGGDADTNSLVISSNICRHNGQFFSSSSSDASLSGGIVCRGPGGGVVISGNTIEDYLGQSYIPSAVLGNEELFAVGAISLGGSTGFMASNPNQHILVTGNTINKSNAMGISMAQTMGNVKVSNNSIRGCVTTDIGFYNNTNGSETRDITISGNDIRRTVNAKWASIYANAIGVTSGRFYIEDNRLEGFGIGNTGANGVWYHNSGIIGSELTIMASVRRNKVSNYYAGVVQLHGLDRAKRNQLHIEDNEIGNVTRGILVPGLTAASLLPVFGNRFIGTVTAKYASGGFFAFDAAFPCRDIRDDTRVEFEASASPTVREFVVGDRAVNSAPAAGSPKAWVCRVAGSPGTWESEGNL